MKKYFFLTLIPALFTILTAFKTVNPEKLIIQIGDFNPVSQKITPEILTKQKKIQLFLENANSEKSRLILKSYTITLLGKSTDGPRKFTILSDNLDPVKSVLDKLVKGDLVQISDVQYFVNSETKTHNEYIAFVLH